MNTLHEVMDESQLCMFIYDQPPELPEPERPTMRLLRDGPALCSNLELLQVVIGGPNAERTARILLDQCKDLRGIASHSAIDLANQIFGLGRTKAAQLHASVELGKRMFALSTETRAQIKTPADAAQIFIVEMSLLEQEEVRTMQLDTRNRVMSLEMIYRGSLNAASMRVGEVFRVAIRSNAASIIIAHNHPSGDPTPSAEDIAVTKALADAGKLLDIELLDHIVVGQSRYVSLKERGLGFGEL